MEKKIKKGERREKKMIITFRKMKELDKVAEKIARKVKSSIFEGSVYKQCNQLEISYLVAKIAEKISKKMVFYIKSGAIQGNR